MASFFVPKSGKQVTDHPGKRALRFGQTTFANIWYWRAGPFNGRRNTSIRHRINLLTAVDKHGVSPEHPGELDIRAVRQNAARRRTAELE
jgi:hypothetical protein